MLVMGRSLLWLGQEYTARVHHCEKSGPGERVGRAYGRVKSKTVCTDMKGRR
jgi:hypothetical protein